jgi:hypothetical protein
VTSQRRKPQSSANGREESQKLDRGNSSYLQEFAKIRSECKQPQTEIADALPPSQLGRAFRKVVKLQR